MRPLALEIMNLAERMEARKAKGFRVSPATAELVIDALKRYARMQVPEGASYKVERWNWKDEHVEEIVASASSGHMLVVLAYEYWPDRLPASPKIQTPRIAWPGGGSRSGRFAVGDWSTATVT
jgi:hypothetical protein